MRLPAALLLAPLLLAVPAAAQPAAVEFVDASRPTRCAEEDNVYVRLLGEGIRRFRIVATPPPYTPLLTENLKDPDFTDCDFSSDPAFSFEPRTVTLYEDARVKLVGWTFESFWRADVIPVRWPGGEDSGLHLLQLFTKTQGPEPFEYLVLYPSDGYWRLRPMTPANLPENAYGSSFLVGPVEESGRPIVDIRSVSFDPAVPGFRLEFARGGRAELDVVAFGRDAAEVEVRLDPPVPAGMPFAALRSMLVAVDNSDAAEAAWRTEPGGFWTVAPIIGFGRAEAVEARFGRTVPSRHNIAAPDTTFRGFER